MLKTLGVVQACSRSSQGRANRSRKLGGQSLLEWVIRRVTDSTRLDGVVVVADSLAAGDDLHRWVPTDVPVFVSDDGDMLTRYAQALEQYPAEAVVRVEGDNPFIDPALVDRLVTAAEAETHCDYAAYALRDGRPAILSPVGVYAEWFRAKALRRADRLAKAAADRQQPTRYLSSHPEIFKMRLLPAPDAIDRDDVRLTVVSDEDWDHALSIYEALGPEALEWQRIAELLDHHPALRQRMAALNRAGMAG